MARPAAPGPDPGSHGGMPAAATMAVLDRVVTGRADSLFAADMADRAAALAAAIGGRRLLVVGGAGAIGAATVALAARFAPAALHVIDVNENALAELVRHLRSGARDLAVADLRLLPVDYGSPIMARFLAAAAPYDAVLHFAALKHVRSEKDVFSLLQMLDTNVVKHARFKIWLAQHGHRGRYFAVSTDKAANPVGLMGASKRLMEDVAFEVATAGPVTAARFANVAFSTGSLLHAWLARLAQRQPLAAPADTRRYFVTGQEAAELCLLAAFAVPAGHVAFPALDPQAALRPLVDVACAVLRCLGLEPELFDGPAAARVAVEACLARRRYPLLVTPRDTSGEKPYEEFVGEGEQAADVGLAALRALAHRGPNARLQPTIDALAALIAAPDVPADKAAVTALVRDAVPGLRHIETHRSLDERA